MQESVDSIMRDRDEVRHRVQTLSQQLNQALKQIGELTVQVNQPQPQTPISQPISAPFDTSGGPPLSSMSLGPAISVQLDDPSNMFEWGPVQTQQLGTTMQMSGPSLARTGTLHFTEPER